MKPEHFHKKESPSEKPVFGIRPVIEAIRSGKEIEKLLVQKNIGNKLLADLKAELGSIDFPVQFVPIEKLNRLSNFKNHQGAAAYLAPIPYKNIENIIPALFEKGETPLILVLDRITDVRNFGAICRTAECAGVHAIVIPAKGSAQITSDAIKTSAGALFRIPVCRSEQLRRTISFLKESGLMLISCTEHADKTVYQADLSGPAAIIMGSEEDGITGEYIKLSDEKVKIPLMGSIASLNVSVASGVVLYEAVRQRRVKK